MKIITDIKPQIKDKKRVSIFLDGNYFCGLDLITVCKNRLKIGQKISENDLIEIQKEGEFQKAFDYSLNYISKSVKTEKQVKDKLILKGYLQEIIDGVIEKLKGYNFIDDNDYCKKYINTYKDKKGLKLIKLELLKKGVDKGVINENLALENSQIEQAISLAKKYVKNKVLDKKNFAKCYNYLLSKGFTYDESLGATKSVFNKDFEEDI